MGKKGGPPRRRVFNQALVPGSHSEARSKVEVYRKLKRGIKYTTDQFCANIVTLSLIIIFCVAYKLYIHNYEKKVAQVRLPLDAPMMISPGAVSADVDPDRFWGTYRSNVYFGMKARSPNSPVFGLMWRTQMVGHAPKVRHWCDIGDRLRMYGWYIHDGINFGIQEMVDEYFRLSTSFVKRPGGLHGGDWSAAFRATPLIGAEEAVVSLYFYTALDGQGTLQPEIEGNRLVSITGVSEELGRFILKFPKSNLETTVKHNYLVTTSPGLHELKEQLMSSVDLFDWDKRHKYIGLGGMKLGHGQKAEYIVHQVTSSIPFEMEVLFESESNSARPNELKGVNLQMELQKHLAGFDVKFEKLFGLKQKGFDEGHIRFAKAALSNMLGGIGYFSGQPWVKSKYTVDPVPYFRATLYTSVPSQSFAPMGFLWNEGFHNILIQKWDQEISMDIIGHWLDLLNSEGWIPRQQILGLEAKARVPDELVVQENEISSPPTLILPLQAIVKKLKESSDPKHRTYLEHLFPRLKAWYNWFNTTQQGPQPGSYRWKGRGTNTVKEINPKSLSSGLDDYPRASHPTSEERHLDLRCWMAVMSKVIADIAKTLKQPWKEYQATYNMLTDSKLLDKQHWSEEKQRYSDYGLHTDDIKLERPKPKQLLAGQRPPPPKEKHRVVKSEPVYRYVDSQFGYVNLFPFLVKIVDPNSPKLGQIIKDIQDPNIIWSKFGLRSLGKSSPLYNKQNTEHDPPYWRGAIWLNINYMALDALHHYAHIQGAYKSQAADVYKQLRDNIIENMYKQYHTTGYVWENYDDKTGEGKGTHPFTGWSALVVAIMAEDY